MNVQELLKETDCKAVAKMWSDRRDEYEEAYDIEVVSAAIDKFVKMLLSLEPIDNKDKILCASVIYEDDGEWLDAAEYIREDLETAIKKCKTYEPITYSTDLSTDELWEVRHKMLEYLPATGYAYEFSNWEEILGFRVIPTNVERFDKQRYIAAVLYEMSFNGFTRESQQERRDELDEAIKECDEHPENLISGDDIFKEWVDPRTPEEIEADRHEDAYNSVRYAESFIAELQRIGAEDINF